MKNTALTALNLLKSAARAISLVAMLLALASRASADCDTPEGGCSSDSDCAECCICFVNTDDGKGYCVPDPAKELPPNTPSTGEECCGGKVVPVSAYCCNDKIEYVSVFTSTFCCETETVGCCSMVPGLPDKAGVPFSKGAIICCENKLYNITDVHPRICCTQEDIEAAKKKYFKCWHEANERRESEITKLYEEYEAAIKIADNLRDIMKQRVQSDYDDLIKNCDTLIKVQDRVNCRDIALLGYNTAMKLIKESHMKVRKGLLAARVAGETAINTQFKTEADECKKILSELCINYSFFEIF